MSHPAFLTDNAHVMLSGVTGSGEGAGGKTATANWWGDQLVAQGHHDYMVAFDPKGRQFEGATVAGPREAAAAVEDGARRLNWSPDAREDMADQHDAAVRFADGLAGPTVFIHDDAVMYAEGDGLAYATALAGNPGPGGSAIKSIVVSQDPWDLPRKSVRTNINNVGWVGEPTPDMRRYMQVMKREHIADEIEARHTDPFVWSVHDGTELHTFDPVPEEYAR